MKSLLLYTDGLLETKDMPISDRYLSRWMNSSSDFHTDLSAAFKTVAIEDDVSFLIIEKQ